MTIYEKLGYDRAILDRIALDINRFYISYSIKKKNGSRRYIDAPQEPLKSIQKSIVYNILYSFRASSIAHGFVKGRSPITNAQVHINKKYILKLDIHNFFNSIGATTVYKTLSWLLNTQKELTVTDEDLLLLTNLITFKRRLPQGSPCSPVMSNLVCLGMDKRLLEFCEVQKLNASITRYADDITISSDVPTIFQLVYPIIKIINNTLNLTINRHKTKRLFYFRRQQVTGVVVNKKLGIGKEIWKNTRAQIHNLLVNNTQISLDEAQKLRGLIEWIKSLNPTRGQQLLGQFSLISVQKP
jgi:RNA-directed DNA polymerase